MPCGVLYVATGVALFRFEVGFYSATLVIVIKITIYRISKDQIHDYEGKN